MSATSRSPKHLAAPPRHRFRLASMELFGFMESPATVDSWTTSEPPPVGQPVGPPRHDPFADWTPTEVAQKLVKSNVRWGFMAGILMIAFGVTGIGYWLYQQPTVATRAAHDELVETAATLQPTIAAILALDLAEVGSTTSQLALVNTSARSLFEVAGTLPNSLSNERSIAAEIAGQSLEGTRILNNAYAYRSAVLPLLEAPQFETDPDAIGLDDAAAVFGIWQTRFQGVATALPSGIMGRLGDELSLISGDLDALQTRYLDALRLDDPEGAALVVHELDSRLGDGGLMLITEFDEMSAAARTQFMKAAEAINLLLG